MAYRRSFRSRRPRRTPRRFGRRSHFRRRRSSTKSWTAQKGTAVTTRFRTGRTSVRKYRGELWRATKHSQHWRSIGQSPNTLSTDGTIGIGEVTLLLPAFVGSPGPTTAFWTATGGAVVADVGGVLPDFIGDITIRGGRQGVTISCEAGVTDVIGVQIERVWLNKIPNLGGIPSTITWGAQVSDVSDFSTNIGKSMGTRKFVLNSDYPSISVEDIFKIAKIDQQRFAGDLGSQMAYFVSTHNLSNSAVVTCEAIGWHNLSFSADAIPL